MLLHIICYLYKQNNIKYILILIIDFNYYILIIKNLILFGINIYNYFFNTKFYFIMKCLISNLIKIFNKNKYFYCYICFFINIIQN